MPPSTKQEQEQDQDRPDEILKRWRNKRLITYLVLISAVLAGVATFSDSISKIYSVIVSLKAGATPVILPKDTGWIFAGYYDASLNKFIEGPFFKIVRSPYPASDHIPRTGEWLKITSERNVVIADFETKGLSRQFDPPWQQNVLKTSDYTGLKLPPGAVVEVRDVSLGAFPGHAAAVWIRIGAAR